MDIHDPAVIKDVQGSRIYTLVDPAIGLKKTNDPTVIATIADATNGRRYVLEIDRRQRKSSEQRDDIFKQVARWGSTAVGIESVAYQKVLCELVEGDHDDDADADGEQRCPVQRNIRDANAAGCKNLTCNFRIRSDLRDCLRKVF